MPVVESKRLRLYPANDEQMARLIENEKNADMKTAYTQMFDSCVQFPEERVWYVLWFIELKDTPNEIAGDFCFKGLNAGGMVEIGYGLRNGFCGKGYMTEALRAITDWALNQKGVKRVEAETDPENEASKKVLLRAGFIETGEYGEEGPRYVFQ